MCLEMSDLAKDKNIAGQTMAIAMYAKTGGPAFPKSPSPWQKSKSFVFFFLALFPNIHNQVYIKQKKKENKKIVN